MTIEKAVSLGKAGNEVSKMVTGTDEVSVERSAVATVSGAALGAGAGVVGASALTVVGVAAAPVTVPLAVAAGVASLVFSLFD